MSDRKNIFATTTRAIEKLRLTVLDAKIITNRKNFVLDTFVVLENNGMMIKNNERNIFDNMNFNITKTLQKIS